MSAPAATSTLASWTRTPVRLAPPSLRYRMFTSFADAEHLREQWDVCVREAGGDIYMTFDWCRIWTTQYAPNHDLRLFLITDSDVLIGIIPIFIDRVGAGPPAIRVARLIGSLFAMDVCNPPLPAEAAEFAADSLIAQLLARDRYDALSLTSIAETSPLRSAMTRAMSEHRPTCTLHHHIAQHTHSAIDLPDSFEGYVSSLSRYKRRNHRRALCALSDEYEVTFDVLCDPRDIAEQFDRFQQMHDAQWETRGCGGRFGDWPGAALYERSLAVEQARLGRTWMHRVLLNGAPVAYQLAWQLGDRLHWRMCARVVDDELNRFSLGTIAAMNLIEQAIGRGVRHVELGRGRYEYKRWLGGGETTLCSLMIVRNALHARLRVRLHCCIAQVLNLLYYRLWFVRLRPHLPLKRRPLWQSWIRTRF